MIVSHNYYYARPGCADAALRQRLSASDVREKIGLPRGRVLRKIEGVDSLPDVIWCIEFADISGHHADMAARAASPAFDAIRHSMRQLYRRFERPLYQACVIPANTLQSEKIRQQIVFINVFVDASDGTALRETLLLQAANTGRVLQLVSEQCGVPQFIWEFSAGDAPEQPQLGNLRHLSARVQSSLWQVAD